MRTAVTSALVVLLTACGGVFGADDEDPLRRTVIQFEVGAQGPLDLDLRADPPVIETREGGPVVPVADLDAARELRERLLDLPPETTDFPATVEPLFAASVSTFPRAQDAELADLAHTHVGGPCSDISSDEVAALVDLWNRAGGDLPTDP